MQSEEATSSDFRRKKFWRFALGAVSIDHTAFRWPAKAGAQVSRQRQSSWIAAIPHPISTARAHRPAQQHRRSRSPRVSLPALTGLELPHHSSLPSCRSHILRRSTRGDRAPRLDAGPGRATFAPRSSSSVCGCCAHSRGCSGGLAGAVVRMTSNARADGATPSAIIVSYDNNQSHPAVAIDCGGAT